MQIVIMLKNGQEVSVDCEECETTADAFGALTEISFKAATDKRIMYMKLSEVVCVYRIFDNEEAKSDQN